MMAQSIKGKVIDSQGAPLEFANVCLLAKADSSFISGAVSKADGLFTIETKTIDGILRVSCMGYETKYTDCHSADAGTIILTPSSNEMAEVVVKGNRRLYTMNAEGLTSNIQGSALGKLPSLSDVLNQLPFLSASDNAINVLGKGKPLVYLDGRKVTDNTELTGLKGNQIKDVHVIMNPGSRYPSNVGAVIRITTIRTQGNGWSGMMQWNGKLNHGFSQDDFLKLNYRKSGLDVFGSVYYKESKSDEEQTNDVKFNYAGTTITSHNANTQNNNSKFLLSQAGANYVSLDNSLYAGLKYIYSRTIKTPFNIYSILTSTDLEGNHTFNNHYFQDNYGGRHNAAAYLLKTFKNKWQLEMNTTYARIDFTSDLNTIETEHDKTITVGSKNNRKTDMFAENVMLTKSMPIGKFTFGEEYSYTDNTQAFELADPDHASSLTSNGNQAKQNSLALFGEYGKAWKHWSTNIGLRYEWVAFDYSLNGIKQDAQSKKYSNLLPTLSLNYSKDKFGTTLSLRSTIARPSYMQLKAGRAYNNRYAYEGGNPSLQPANIYDLGLLLRYKDFVLSSNYIIYKNAISFYEQVLEDKPVRLNSFINIDYQSFNLMASYAPTLGIWKPSVTLQAYFQQLDYNGMKYTKPIAKFSFKSLFSFPKSYTVTLNFSGYTAGNDGLLYYKQNFTASASFIKNFPFGLLVALSMEDIFHTSRERWTIKAPNVEATKWLKGDTQSFTLTVRYSFNTARSKYKGKGAGNSEINRF
ncbi:TonB-dependent receptor family protein [Prevotella falsenii]|uniref:TonB-dependent receptor family protein n=1 Tax=Prevotella falsenii TaxID=515414 RepID=UPI001E4F5BE5|nr:TonB-dependent receptor family protein [Prevotella falsenii]